MDKECNLKIDFDKKIFQERGHRLYNWRGVVFTGGKINIYITFYTWLDMTNSGCEINGWSIKGIFIFSNIYLGNNIYFILHAGYLFTY